MERRPDWRAGFAFASVTVNEGASRLMSAGRTGSADLGQRGGLSSAAVPWADVAPPGSHPSRSRLAAVQDFFVYTQREGESAVDQRPSPDCS